MKTIGEFFNYTLAVKDNWMRADSLRFSQTQRQAEHSAETARLEYLSRYSLSQSVRTKTMNKWPSISPLQALIKMNGDNVELDDDVEIDKDGFTYTLDCFSTCRERKWYWPTAKLAGDKEARFHPTGDVDEPIDTNTTWYNSITNEVQS